MKFRKKPVVIEAWHFTDESKNIVFREISAKQMNIYASYDNASPVIRIPTLEGEMTASLNDWIIQGVNGELYPCKPDIFEKTYEEVIEE